MSEPHAERSRFDFFRQTQHIDGVFRSSVQQEEHAPPTARPSSAFSMLANPWMRYPLPTANDALPRNHFTSSKRALGGSVDTIDILTQSQREAVQVVACALAGLTLCSIFISFYWFSLMRKKFRHKLIMTLIVADFVRAFWIFIFPAVSLARGRVSSASSFCQVSGYLTQTGTEMADFSTLSIAVHTAMQILKPQISFHGSRETGLHPYRYPLFIAITVAPLVLAALPFIRSRDGYLSQGALCTLPLRPFWYRLATSWIPRYVVLLTIFLLYIAIYIYVWRHFKRSPALLKGRKSHSSPFDTSATTESRFDGTTSDATTVRQAEPYTHAQILPGGTTGGPPQPLDSAAIFEWRSALALRRESDGTTLVDPASPLRALDEGARFKRQSSNNQSQAVGETRVYDGPFDHVLMPRPRNPPVEPSGGSLPSVEEMNDLSEPQHGQSARTMSRDLQRNSIEHRYKAIKRQLNLLFVYPICYFFMWLLPLAYNICNYNSHLVQDPVFPLVLLNTVCISAMGLVDCVIFSVREKPWRHIPGSDGTFWGSFLFWRHADVDAQHAFVSSVMVQPQYSNRHSLTERSSSTGTAKRRPTESDWTGSRNSSVAQSSAGGTRVGIAAAGVSAIDETPEIEKEMREGEAREKQLEGGARDMYWFDRWKSNDSEGNKSLSSNELNS